MKHTILAGLLVASLVLGPLPASAAPTHDELPAEESAAEVEALPSLSPSDDVPADEQAGTPVEDPAPAGDPAPAADSAPVGPVAEPQPAPPAADATAATPPSVGGPAALRINMADNRFVGGTTTVPAGTTVTWVNNGSNAHTVSDGNGLFDSGSLARGAEYSFTFSAPGTYRYICRQHLLSGMFGTITVQ